MKLGFNAVFIKHEISFLEDGVIFESTRNKGDVNHCFLIGGENGCVLKPNFMKDGNGNNIYFKNEKGEVVSDGFIYPETNMHLVDARVINGETLIDIFKVNDIHKFISATYVGFYKDGKWSDDKYKNFQVTEKALNILKDRKDDEGVKQNG